MLSKIGEWVFNLLGLENPFKKVKETAQQVTQEALQEIAKPAEQSKQNGTNPNYKKENNQTLINENQQKEYNISEWQTWAEEQQKKQWEREDAIRKETQEREDTAISRAVQDARNSGANVNLMNLNPAQAGGGITTATGINTNLTERDLQNDLELLTQMIENEFKADENQKDRFTELFKNILTFFILKKV